tara:strand:- start:52 stop:405 length:354 start_codon:yes stop_codon:yes gene_type:complete
MSPSTKKYGLIAIKILLTVAFVAAGTAKLTGVEMMVGTFDTIGWGQWFRYLTGSIEIISAALLWVRGREWIGAGLLTCTMGAAVLFHILLLGPTLVPALILGILAAIVFATHRPATA